MINCFFINPAAGQGKGIDKLKEEIRQGAESLGFEYEIYMTREEGDGEVAAKRIAERLGGKEARFYACGGDGTFNEVINGTRGFDNIAIGCVPIGTGNDMVRNFPEAGNFLNMRQQLSGTDIFVDLIRYHGVFNDMLQTRYCANMFNIGFDCNVVELAGRLKKKPLISGSFAYMLAVACMFIKKDTIGLHLEENGEVILDKEVLLCAVANGSYCGGGIKTTPQADVQDGFFDLNIIQNVSRGKFLKLFPAFAKGEHIGMSGLEDIITMKQCTSLKLMPKEDSFFLCADGEICAAKWVEFEMAPRALRFILPKA